MIHFSNDNPGEACAYPATLNIVIEIACNRFFVSWAALLFIFGRYGGLAFLSKACKKTEENVSNGASSSVFYKRLTIRAGGRWHGAQRPDW